MRSVIGGTGTIGSWSVALLLIAISGFSDTPHVEAGVQLGVTLEEDDTRSIFAFLDSITGSLPVEFTTIPAAPLGTVVVSQ